MVDSDLSGQWASSIHNQIEGLGDKLDNFQERNIELWNELRKELDAVRSESLRTHGEQSQKIVALSTEISNWRWGLLICFGMVLASVTQLILAQLHLVLPNIH